MNTNDEQKEIRKWAMLCHLSSILVWIPVSVISALFGIPMLVRFLFLFLSILGPLCVWQFKKNLDPAIDYHGKESVNFQLSLLIYWIILAILCFLLFYFTCRLLITPGETGLGKALIASAIMAITLMPGAVISVIMGIAAFILVIFASIKASKGEFYRYPFTIRFPK
jgi:uncharacterized protein